MNKIMTTVIVAFGFIAANLASLTVRAETSVLSFQGAYVSTDGYNGNLHIHLQIYEIASKDKSVKSNSSLADAEGEYFDGTYFYRFNGDPSVITFNSVGSLPKNVTASGSISGTWSQCDYYSCFSSFPDTVTFNVNADALKNQASSESGMYHYDGEFIQNTNYQSSSVPAVLSNSSIMSLFGDVTPTMGSMGLGKGITVLEYK